MKTEKDKFYITTSIPYLNAPPHLGFALEALQADVVARHSRLRDKDVFFLSGTDEHGAKIEEKAREAGMDPQKFADEVSASFSLASAEAYFPRASRISEFKNHAPAEAEASTIPREAFTVSGSICNSERNFRLKRFPEDF